MPSHNRHLARLYRWTCVVAVLAAAAVVRVSAPAHPPERVTTAVAAPPEYSGPTTDTHDELVSAVGQAQLAAWYSAASQPPPTSYAAPRSTRPKEVAPAPAPSTAPLEAIAAHFGDIYDQAVGVARCESTLDPTAISGGNYGLFQINAVHRARVEAMGYRWSQILDPNVNAAVARAIYDDQGWGPWACRWAARR